MNSEERNYHFLKNVMNYDITDEMREWIKKADSKLAKLLISHGEYKLHEKINDTMRTMMWQEGFKPSMDNHRFAFSINDYPCEERHL